MQQGKLGPATLLDDSAGTWYGQHTHWQPDNVDHRFGTLIRADHALARSRNLPAIRVLQAAGPGPTSLLRSAGFAHLNRSAEHYGLSLAIGGGEITLREAAAAYAMRAWRCIRGATPTHPHRATTAPRSQRPSNHPPAGNDRQPLRNAALDPRLAGRHIAWKPAPAAAVGMPGAWRCRSATPWPSGQATSTVAPMLPSVSFQRSTASRAPTAPSTPAHRLANHHGRTQPLPHPSPRSNSRNGVVIVEPSAGTLQATVPHPPSTYRAQAHRGHHLVHQRHPASRLLDSTSRTAPPSRR